MKNTSYSLEDLLGNEYIHAVCGAKAFLSDTDLHPLLDIAKEKYDFFPKTLQDRLDELLPRIGTKVIEGMPDSPRGAGSAAFMEATNIAHSPLSALGFFRIGEDGRLYLTTKSEHYHASLGHDFPGYRLIEKAKELGIANITHNNTRGYITRLLERELVRTVNSLPDGDEPALNAVLVSTEPGVLNRIINLQTGSLAVEAALKAVLTRFYRFQPSDPKPLYEGRVPVILVIADNNSGPGANYHGTTILTQVMRGLWPEFSDKVGMNGILRAQPVTINDADHFRKVTNEFEKPPYKVAAFFHEIILMNYGAIRLREDYLNEVYEVCRAADIPIVVDEIQSSVWYPELFLFKQYGLKPDFVSVGKGFPGGQYAAAKIITTAKMDSLSLFGALVTNGQEELASLAYLITMAFVKANKSEIREKGDYYMRGLLGLKKKYPRLITKIEGLGHLASLFFDTAADADKFSKGLNKLGMDISAHTYKANGAPSALTKLPLISSEKMIDTVLSMMEKAIGADS